MCAVCLCGLRRSVLLLEDKTAIGRVEEVFGPLTMPLYALRYGGPQPPPAGLAAGARIFFTGQCRLECGSACWNETFVAAPLPYCLRSACGHASKHG